MTFLKLKRKDINELIKQKETHSQTQRINLWLPGVGEEGCGEGIVREFWMVRYTLLYSKQITNKDLLYSTWNSTPCYVAACTGGEFGGEQIHVYVWLSPFIESVRTLLIGYTPIQNKKLFFFKQNKTKQKPKEPAFSITTFRLDLWHFRGKLCVCVGCHCCCYQDARERLVA